MIDKLGNVSAFYNIQPIAFRGTETNPIPEQKSDTFELSEKEEENSSNKTKWAIAAAAILSAIGIGIAIYKHKNPSKAVENAGESLANAGKKAEQATANTEKPLEKAAKENADDVEKLAKETEAAAKTEQERLAKEAEQKAEQERLAKEATEKAEKEAQEKAEREALEAKVAQMKKVLPEYAEDLIKSMQEQWKNEAGRLVRLFETAEQKGFEALKGTKAVLSDGTHVISHSNGKSSPYTYTYLSKDGKTLDEIIAFKDGKKLYSAQLDNPNHLGYHETVSIGVLDEEGKNIKRIVKFNRDRKKPEFVEWCRFNKPKAGAITHIQRANNVDGMANYEVTFIRPDDLGSSFWIKQPT